MSELKREVGERLTARREADATQGDQAETAAQQEARQLSERRAGEFIELMLNNVPTSPLYVRYMKNIEDRERRRASYYRLGEGWHVLEPDIDGRDYGRFLLSTGVTYLCGTQQTVQPDDTKQKLELPYYLAATPTPVGEFLPATETAPFATDQGKEWLIATLMAHEAAIPDSAWRNF